MKSSILKDFPDRFETERLRIRCPLTGDGPELFAAIRESHDELKPWMPWVESHKTADDSEESASRVGRVPRKVRPSDAPVSQGLGHPGG